MTADCRLPGHVRVSNNGEPERCSTCAKIARSASPVGSSVPGDTEKGISDEQRALQEQVERPNFEGHEKRECGEHRTVGPHRAWCYDCTEWCYPRPEMACKGCMVPMLQAEVERLTKERDHAIHERVTSNAAAVHMLRMVAERTADYTPDGTAMRLRAEADRLEARETTEAVR